MLADANLKDIPRVRWLIQHTIFFLFTVYFVSIISEEL